MRSARLLPELGYPLILLWKGAHFLVLDGLDDEYAWLNDPASGRGACRARSSTASTPVLPVPPARPRLRARRRAAAALAAWPAGCARCFRGARRRRDGAARDVPGLAVAAVAKFFVDDVLVAGSPTAPGRSSACWPRSCSSRPADRLPAAHPDPAEHAADGRRVGKFVRHALRLPERYFVARSVSDLALRVQHNREVAVLLTGKLASAAVGLVVMVVYGLRLLLIDPLLARDRDRVDRAHLSPSSARA